MRCEPFGVVALISAYTDPQAEQWLLAMNAYVNANYRILCNLFSSKLPWLPVTRLEGTYLVWCDCRSLGLSSKELEKILVNAGVHVNAGSMYGESGDGFIRINLACPKSLLTEGLDRIVQTLDKLRR